MRSGGLASEDELLALRGGTVRFEEFVRRPEVKAAAIERARYFLRKWPRQDLHDEEDLAQDAMVALWRAVDTWKPIYVGRTVETEEFCGVRFVETPIKRYVEYQVGRVLERKLRKASGYPRKGRPLPARRVAVQDFFTGSRDRRELTIEDLGDVLHPVEPQQARVLEALERAAVLECPVEREVVAALFAGGGVDDAARVIYEDVSWRRGLRLDSYEHAARMVRKAAGRAARRIADADAG